MKIALLGSGALSHALATRLSQSPHDLRIASREPSDRELPDPLAAVPLVTYREAAAWADAVVLALPLTALAEALPPLRGALAGKVVLDPVNGIAADWSPADLGPDASVAARVARLLPESRVVKAFNMIFADALGRPASAGAPLAVFAAGDDPAAVAVATDLIRACGLDAVAVAGLANAAYLEAMAHLNIAVALAGGGTAAGFAYLRLD